MSKNRRSLKTLRSKAFHAQDGRCYYCRQPIWKDNLRSFADQFDLSLSAANKLRCTGEHLTPHEDGGTETVKNIVAACQYCNRQRHRTKRIKSPDQYTVFVTSRLARGKWHGLRII